jgi:hypothetical protein
LHRHRADQQRGAERAGHHYDGHTGMLAAFSGSSSAYRLLASERLSAIHVSTHVSLRSAIERAKPERILATIRYFRLHRDFLALGLIEDKIQCRAADERLFLELAPNAVHRKFGDAVGKRIARIMKDLDITLVRSSDRRPQGHRPRTSDKLADSHGRWHPKRCHSQALDSADVSKRKNRNESRRCHFL